MLVLFNLQTSTTDLLLTYNTVANDMKLYAEGNLSEDNIASYKSLAKLNGYQSIESFMNEYLPLLRSQLTTEE